MSEQEFERIKQAVLDAALAYVVSGKNGLALDELTHKAEEYERLWRERQH